MRGIYALWHHSVNTQPTQPTPLSAQQPPYKLLKEAPQHFLPKHHQWDDNLDIRISPLNLPQPLYSGYCKSHRVQIAYHQWFESLHSLRIDHQALTNGTQPLV